MKKVRKEDGVTLVEVLVAMTILSIIIISIMMIFPQMGMMNKYNLDKTQAVNTAKQVLNDWKADSQVLSALKKHNPSANDWPESFVSEEDNFYLFRENDPEAEIKIQKEPDLKPSYGENQYKAHQIYIKILDHRDNGISETYGYVLVGVD